MMHCTGGNQSGASQLHKHLQFIPVDLGDTGPPIETLAKSQTSEAQGMSHNFKLQTGNR